MAQLPLRIAIAYSLGHFQNDLMASMWFSFFLVFLQKVKSFNSVYAGSLLLIGQIADAIATPLIGYEADHASGYCGYTKYKSWHLFGTICTTASFPLIFSPVIGASEGTSDEALFVYYCSFVVVFQIGWACVQISHLSLLPQLTLDESDVSGLVGWRNAATGFANFTTFAIAWAILSSDIESGDLSSADYLHFRDIACIVASLGVVTSLAFHVCTPELIQLSSHPVEDDEHCCSSQSGISVDGNSRSEMSCRKRGVFDWFKDIKYYQVAILYMCSRLFVNLSQVYMPMYLTECVHLSKESIANVPLTSFASTFFVSTSLKMIDKWFGRKITFSFGLLFAFGASVLFYWIPVDWGWIVYIAAVITGAGGALLLTTSLAFVADLIGDFTGSSAFVYGSMSFTDKLANGAAVEIVQMLQPCRGVCCPLCEPYYRSVQSFVPGGAACLGLLALLTVCYSGVNNRSNVLSQRKASNGPHVSSPVDTAGTTRSADLLDTTRISTERSSTSSAGEIVTGFSGASSAPLPCKNSQTYRPGFAEEDDSPTVPLLH